jgi:hypothetical protein
MQHTPGVLYIQGVLLLVASQAPCLPTKVATVTTLRRFVPKKREARSEKRTEAERVKIADATLSSSTVTLQRAVVVIKTLCVAENMCTAPSLRATAPILYVARYM